jgi:hypothetical protein
MVWFEATPLKGKENPTLTRSSEFFLTEVIKEDEPEQAYTPEEEEETKERLRRLGYIE